MERPQVYSIHEGPREEGEDFTNLRLPARTGNRPELLASLQSEDAFHLDPAAPPGCEANRRCRATSRGYSPFTALGSGPIPR